MSLRCWIIGHCFVYVGEHLHWHSEWLCTGFNHQCRRCGRRQAR